MTSSLYSKFGLSVNCIKTQVIYQPAPRTGVEPPSIKINNETLQSVEQFLYLGSFLSSKVNIGAEINHRLQCASAAYVKLWKRVFGNHDIRNQTKVSVYNAVVIPTLIYSAETWTTYRRHIQKLETFHQRCLRRIFRIHWRERRTNISILQQADFQA